MKVEILGNIRRDGKYLVRTIYKGAPNMFGGRDPARVFRNILTPQQVRELLASPSFEGVNWNGYDDARKQLSAAEAKKEKTPAQRLNFHLQFAGIMASVGRDEKRDEHYIKAQELAQELVDAGH